VKGYNKPEDLLGPGGLLKQLMGKLISRAMDAELTHHLDYERGEERTATPGNRATVRGARRSAPTEAPLRSKCRVIGSS